MISKYFLTLFFLFSISLLHGETVIQSLLGDPIGGMYPVRLLRNGKMGFNLVNREGKFFYPTDFNFISYFDQNVAYAYVRVRESVYSYYILNISGDSIYLKNIYPKGITFSESVIPAFSIPSEGYGFIGTLGQFVIPPVYSDALSFSHGLAPVRDSETNLWGFINHRNEMIIPCRYSDATPFSVEGIAGVCQPRNRKWNFINIRGEKVNSSHGYLAIGKFSNGLCQVKESYSDSWHFIDLSGKRYFDNRFKKIEAFSEGLAAVSSDGKKYGFINVRGEMIIPEISLEAIPFRRGVICVASKDDRVIDILLDSKGDTIICMDELNKNITREFKN